MKALITLLGLLILFISFSCKKKTRQEKSSDLKLSNFATNNSNKIKLNYGVITLKNGYKALYLGASSKPPAHRYHCEVCLLEGQSCRSIDLSITTQLLVGLAAGKYNIDISACTLTNPASKVASCGQVESYPYEQPTNDPNLTKLMVAQNKTIGQLDLQAKLLHQAAVNENKKDDSNSNAKNLAKLGPQIIATALLSDALSAKSIAAAKKEQSPSPSPSPSPKSHLVNDVSMILIALGSVTFLSSLFALYKIGYYKKLVNTKFNKVSGVSFVVEPAKAVFESNKKMIQNIIGKKHSETVKKIGKNLTSSAKDNFHSNEFLEDQTRETETEFRIGVIAGISLIIAGAITNKYSLAQKEDRFLNKVKPIAQEVINLRYQLQQRLVEYKRKTNKNAMYDPNSDSWIWYIAY